jgi:predicted ribosome quality control (RQC) complex YloA/Tae2 family protein
MLKDKIEKELKKKKTNTTRVTLLNSRLKSWDNDKKNIILNDKIEKKINNTLWGWEH